MEKIVKLIREAKSFLVTTHHLPDGDGLGAQMAFHRAIRAAGKTSHVINSSPTPDKFQITDPHREILVYSPGMPLPTVDLVLVMDTNDYSMLGPLEAPLRALGARVLFVDHHITELADADQHLIEDHYGSTGELLFDLLTALGLPLDREIATALYTAIITDTGHFRFKRTRPSSHRAAATLLEKGVEPETAYRAIYAHDSLAKVKLLGHVLQGIAHTADGKIAWLTVPAELRRRYGATLEDTESFVNQMTLLDGVEIGMVFREENDGRIKVSLRGNGEVPVYPIAQALGGGGHRHAAGVRLTATLAEAVRALVKAAQAALKG